MFQCHDGEPLDTRSLTEEHFRPALRAAGIKRTLKCQLEDLTHTVAALHLRNGESLEVVRQLLGLETVEHVKESYSDHTVDPILAAVARMSTVIRSTLDS